MTFRNRFHKRIVMPVMAAAMATAFTITGVNHTAEAANRSINFTKWERSVKTAETHAGRKRKHFRAGVVSSVSGNELTIVANDNTSYEVDASKATVMKGSASTTPYIISTAGIHIGDRVIVRGKINETIITAKSILDEAL